MAMNIDELLRDAIENRDRSATNKNLFNFNCLIHKVIGSKKSLEDLTNDEKAALLKCLKSVKIRIFWILLLIVVSFCSILVMMVLGNI